MNKQQKQLQTIVEVEDSPLSVREIELICASEQVTNRYLSQFGPSLYGRILLTLTHETFDESLAQKLWQAILLHRQQMKDMLGRDVGISVATMDYMTNIAGLLKWPKIIEQDKSDYISRASTTDELTGLYLRDVFDLMLMKEFDESQRKSRELCLLMLDIDDFKRINDQYGHVVGDEVLMRVGQCINMSVREMDLAARYGGEELAVIMPSTNLKQANKIAQRIRKRIAKLSFDGFSITVSGGVAQCCDNAITLPQQLIEMADKLLYQAKAQGKNQILHQQKPA